MPRSAVIKGDDRRRLVPQALCAVIRALLDEELDDPTYRWTELRRMLRSLETMYGLSHGETPANATEVAQHLQEEDGIPQEDLP